MKLSESIAAKCRYGENALEAFYPDAELIWESSEDDYQGYANILLQTPDGRFAHYDWTYGSCSSCDEWEARELTDREIVEIMKESAAWFNDIATLEKYLRLNGSIPGMLRLLSGDLGDDFIAMGKAFTEWKNK